MLQSLISLSDEEIEAVTSSVREWCRANHCEGDSSEGRRALTVEIDLVQSKHTEKCVVALLSQRLAPASDSHTG